MWIINKCPPSTLGWQRYFDDVIIYRGAGYHRHGNIYDYRENDHELVAKVMGSQSYNVYIGVDKKRCEIKEFYCDCPYADSGYNYKHEVAVLLEYESRHHSNEIITPDDMDIKVLKRQIQRTRQKYLRRYAMHDEIDNILSSSTSTPLY